MIVEGFLDGAKTLTWAMVFLLILVFIFAIFAGTLASLGVKCGWRVQMWSAWGFFIGARRARPRAITARALPSPLSTAPTGVQNLRSHLHQNRLFEVDHLNKEAEATVVHLPRLGHVHLAAPSALPTNRALAGLGRRAAVLLHRLLFNLSRVIGSRRARRTRVWGNQRAHLCSRFTTHQLRVLTP